MKVYKLKFENEQQAIDFFESVKEGLIDVARVEEKIDLFEYDIIHANENIITIFEVTPTVIKHNFL